MWNTKYFKPFNLQQRPICWTDLFNDNVRRNWYIYVVNSNSKRVDVDCGRYSSRCKYHKIEHRYYIHACYRIVNKGKTLKVSFDRNLQKNGRQQYNINIGGENNWIFKDDEYGIYITDGKADYHLQSKDILNFNFRQCVVHALRNYSRRLEEKLVNEFIVSNADKIKVTMQDSLNAGNCEAGTIGFIQRYFGINPKREDYTIGIQADKLLATGNLAAKRAVIIAAQRQYMETI